MLVVQTLKRSAGIGGGGVGSGSVQGGGVAAGINKEAARALEDAVEELAESFMVLIAATGFLEFEEEMAAPKRDGPQAGGLPVLFH